MFAQQNSGDKLVSYALEILREKPDVYTGPHIDSFLQELGREHGAGNLYLDATTEAIIQSGLEVESPEKTALGVYRNFLWTHFVCKLLMTVSPSTAVYYTQANFDFQELQTALDSCGSAIISCFHYTGYPILALGLATSKIAPLISKARVDFLDKSPAQISDHVVYLTDRSAPIQLTRALKSGRSVWIMLDVVLPSVRVVRTQFLGSSMNVSAGIDTIARLSGRPCLPLFWELTDQGLTMHTGSPIYQTEGEEDTVIRDFVSSQAAFIAKYPTQWLEWYSILDRGPEVRAIVKQANEEIWNRFSSTLNSRSQK